MKTNRNLFDLPLPIYSYEVGLKSKPKILDSRHISSSHDKTRKAKRQIVLSRPDFNLNEELL